MKNPESSIEDVRHSLAHLLAAAVMELWPDTKRTIGPAIDNGFYFDFEFAHPVSDADLPKIEEKMREILPTWDEFTKHLLSAEDAKKEYPDNRFKHELIDEFSENGTKELSFYRSGNYWDLCRGGHVTSAKEIDPKAFKLDKLAGAYWRGSEKNPQLTRIYGLAFTTKEELDEYLKMREEAEKRDHRLLGKQLEIFTFSEEVGQGLILWLPNGALIRHELEKWAWETEEKWGYGHVNTPHITKGELFKISGHLPFYKDDLYSPFEIEGEEYYLKPMNCPYAHMIYKSRPRSYRELPLRLAEYGQVYRYERSGTLHGLMRARGFCQNDAHIYVKPEETIEEFVRVFDMHRYYYEKLGIADWWVVLGVRDPKNLRAKYHGDNKMWEEAEALTLQALKESGVKYEIEEGGAAHYGPKADIYIRSVIGKEYAIGTTQLDLYMPDRFNLRYTDKDGSEKMPYVLHRAPLGSHERMIGFLLEHFAGAFPVWLAPVQATVLPVGEKFSTYAEGVVAELKAAGIRAELSEATESLGKRIREAKMKKIPYLLVVGEKEETNRNVSVQHYARGQEGELSVGEVAAKIGKEIKEKALQG